MSAQPSRVSKYRVNRVSMPFGNDSFFTFTLNHDGMSRMIAMCFDGSEIYDTESVDVMMQRVFTTFIESVQRATVEQIADAQAKGDNPVDRDKIIGLHLGRDPDGQIYLTPAHLAHAKECGWIDQETQGT